MRAGTWGKDPDVVGERFFVLDSRAAAKHEHGYCAQAFQLDWLKSLTNRSNLLYILVGNFLLYDFCHPNGQVARRVREEQFAATTWSARPMRWNLRARSRCS